MEKTITMDLGILFMGHQSLESTTTNNYYSGSLHMWCYAMQSGQACRQAPLQ